MFEKLFRGLFDSELTAVISVRDFLICLGFSLMIGLIMALSYTFRTRYTRSFLTTLALLPAVVCVVIMLVNGNVGTGVAVAGAFSLVRFRSVPGTAKEICMLFIAMGAGLITGMGYIGFALLFTLIMCLFFILYGLIGFGGIKQCGVYRTLNVIVPEDLNYTDIFTDIFEEYTTSSELSRVKTTNMGSLFKLTYQLKLKSASREKEMIDKIRQRNGNLEVSLSLQDSSSYEL